MSADWTIIRYGTVNSTQRIAAALIARGAAHRTAITAERQTDGYGRKGDRWLDAPGANLLLTLILRPTREDTATLYAMAGSLATGDAITTLTGMRAAIKWPNDVLLGGRKVAGILGDAVWHGGRLEALRIGIGVNLCGARADFAARGLPEATSIAAETGISLSGDAVLTALLARVDAYDALLTEGDSAPLAAAWRAASDTLGRAVSVALRTGEVICGVAHDLADDGDLIVVTAHNETRRLRAPEVRALRALP